MSVRRDNFHGIHNLIFCIPTAVFLYESIIKIYNLFACKFRIIMALLIMFAALIQISRVKEIYEIILFSVVFF
jgi:hypothetical protein